MAEPVEIQAPTAAEHAAGLARYCSEGRERALALGNRGPLRLTGSGKLHPQILDAYWRTGFYVFDSVINPDELTELRADIDMMIERAPVSSSSQVDARGHPALGLAFERDTYLWVAPLADPVGGTAANGGRHPAKMVEPAAPAQAPDEVIYMMFGMCQVMDSALRLYGHPQLLAVAASINGDDFTPYNDAIFVKPPRLGGSVAWHQDGLTHWNSAAWDEGIHGFNFQVQLYPSTPANCLWVVPGTHKLGKLDIKTLVEENGGSEQLPEAVPLFCESGGVTIVNRQALHCSFANTSADPRISLTFGFHRRAAVIGQHGVLGADARDVYDEARIHARSAVLAVAIDARRQHYSAETPFCYLPFTGLEDQFRWNEHTRETVIRNYNLQDLGI